MEKKDRITAVVCPFCIAQIWFENTGFGRQQFKIHVQKEHLRELVNFILENSVEEVMKTHLKWCIK